MHGFEFPSAAPRPPTVCLTAIFGKIGRKSLNHVKALKSYPVHVSAFERTAATNRKARENLRFPLYRKPAVVILAANNITYTIYAPNPICSVVLLMTAIFGGGATVATT